MIRVGIITISDRSYRGEREDLSGPALIEKVTDAGFHVISTAIIPDEFDEIKSYLIKWCDSGNFDLILTTGGTGFAPRDVTPEATLAVLDKTAPGIAEAMRGYSMKITPHAMLSRQQAGIRKKTLIINLPGSPKGAVENLEYVLPVLPHAIELLREDPSAEKGHQQK
ncbi:MAG: MogA/MoaB family molybdenum cofactor biosynthesis protein [Chloroflexota bacterium]